MSPDFRSGLLGRTGLRVGRLGVAASYGVPASTVERAFDTGVNYFYWGSRRTDVFADALQRLGAWLSEQNVTHVAMEATGVYWKPVWNVLEGLFDLMLVTRSRLKGSPERNVTGGTNGRPTMVPISGATPRPAQFDNMGATRPRHIPPVRISNCKVRWIARNCLTLG